MRTLAVINQKGGCGKTTTSINLAAVFASRGYRTLLVDLDPQGHCAAGLAVPEGKIDKDIGDAMLAVADKPVAASKLLWRVARNLDLVPSRTRLAGLEAAKGGLAQAPDREKRLLMVIEQLTGTAGLEYDVCLIDCPPSIGLLTYNALTAAREILIPVETSFFSLQGAAKQLSTVRSVGRRIGMRHRPRLIPTIHDPASALARDLLEELRERFTDRVIPRAIRMDENVKRAASYGVPVIEYAPATPASEDYVSLAEWLMEHSRLERGGADAIDDDETPEIGVLQDGPPIGARWSNAREPIVPTETRSPTRDLASNGQATPSPTVEIGTGAGTMPALSRREDLRRRANLLRPGDAGLGGTQTLTEAPSQSGFPLGVRVAGGRATFVQPLAEGRQLAIAGSFNQWSSTTLPMRRDESLGVHELTVPLEPGTHRYRVVVDGRWNEDRYNPNREPNAFGETDSVVVIPARQEA
ncbi:MAG: AAA family ATPase [Planctomycetota bacterium]